MNIAPEYIYGYAYRLLDQVTPLLHDCGRRCGGACCEDSDSGTGMYLYPGEKRMYQPLPGWARIDRSGFFYPGGEADILECDGSCDRLKRPLACRIFPLVPYKKQGEKMRIIYDPRATAMCPLRPQELTDKFVRNVTCAMCAVEKLKSARLFIEAQSMLIDAYVKFKL